MSSLNRDALTRVAGALGPITRELVFVGGRVAELLVTEAGTTRVRPTYDSDAVCEVATRAEYHRLGERLRGAGFREDQRPGAPTCRWRHGEDTLDVMPTNGDVLGFQNAWYHHAVRLATEFTVSAGVSIRVVPAPVFLATKWDAFNDRGAGDWYGSHDLEDVVMVVAGRRELLEELRATERDVRRYVAIQTRTLLNSGVAEDVLAGALPDARQVPGLIERVLRRLEAIAQLESAEQ
jgi:hypothetical protein